MKRTAPKTKRPKPTAIKSVADIKQLARPALTWPVPGAKIIVTVEH